MMSLSLQVNWIIARKLCDIGMFNVLAVIFAPSFKEELQETTSGLFVYYSHFYTQSYLFRGLRATGEFTAKQFHGPVSPVPLLVCDR